MGEDDKETEKLQVAFGAVTAAALDGDWTLALVEMCALANSHTLRHWERQRSSDWQRQVQALVKRLQQPGAQIPAVLETPAQGIPLLMALDELTMRTSGAIRLPPPIEIHTGARYWAVPTGSDLPRNCAQPRQAANLSHWLAHYSVVPEKIGPIQVKVYTPQGDLGQRLTALASRPGAKLGIWIGHFDDAAAVQWNAQRRTEGFYLAEGIEPATERDASLLKTLDASWQSGGQVLVLPELGLTVAQRQLLVRRMTQQPEGAPLLCVPGSFHEHNATHVYNCAPLLNGTSGEPLFTHQKLRPYGNSAFESGQEGSEDIDLGQMVHLLVTDIGGITVLICKDHLDSHADVATLMQQLAPHWLFVPSYGGGKTVAAHQRQAERLCKVEVGCHVAVANIRNVGIEDGDHLPGFGAEAGVGKPLPVPASGGLIHFDLPSRTAPDESPPSPQPLLKLVKRS